MSRVTVLDDVRQARTQPTALGGLPVAAELAGHAVRLLEEFGHRRTDFGSPGLGYSVAGAIFAGAGIGVDGDHLRDVVVCDPCQARRRVGGGRAAGCDGECDQATWDRCQLAFAYVVEALDTPLGRRPRFDNVTITPARDFAAIREANSRIGIARARRALSLVWAAGAPVVARVVS